MNNAINKFSRRQSKPRSTLAGCLTTETPLDNKERLYLYRQKMNLIDLCSPDRCTWFYFGWKWIKTEQTNEQD